MYGSLINVKLEADAAVRIYVLFHCTLYVFDKSHPSKCFSYESISLFWYYSVKDGMFHSTRLSPR
jgi:hypothetical protein